MDEYSGKYSLLRKYLRDVCAADAWLATDSGTRLAIRTFSDDVKADEGEYASHELPAMQFECLPVEGGSGRDSGEGDEDTFGRIHMRVGFLVAIIVEKAMRQERITLAEDIVARVERVLLNQFGSNQMGGLDQVLPGGDPGSITTYLSGPVIEDSGQTSESSRSSRCVAGVFGRIEYDEDFDV